MAKGQTIIWTAVPHGRSGAGPGDDLRLSVVVTPQLWNTDPSVVLMHLADFPDWKDFPAALAGMTFEVDFDGVVRPATVEPGPTPSSALWKGLFDDNTPVFPYRFERDDTSGDSYLVLQTSVLGEYLGRVYAEVGTDPALGGGGAELPQVGDLGRAMGVGEIARPTVKDPPYRTPARPRVPVPAPELPTPPHESRPGCLAWLWRILCWLATYVPFLRPLLKGKCPPPEQPPSPVPDYQVEPFPPATRPAPPEMPTVSVFTGPDAASPPPAGPAVSTVSAPSAQEKAAFADSDAYFATSPSAFRAMPTEAELAKLHDFHEIVSLLGDYPTLLRRLGLVVDLVVAADPAIPTADTATVRVRATWTPATSPTTAVSPRTHYVLADGAFAARARTGATLRLSNGFLDLSDPTRNPVTQVDVAGSTKKFRNAATNVVVGADPSSAPALQPEQDGLPALQTEGLAVTQTSLVKVYQESALIALALHNFLVSDEAKQGAAKPDVPIAGAGVSDELWADMLLRGYRLDVHDVKANTWFSLHRRDSRYDFTRVGEKVVVLDEEGFVEPSSTRQADTPGKIRIHETLFSWQGWSLSVPRPHQGIVADDAPKDPPVPVVAHLDSTPMYGLDTWYRVTAGSLPRLRFGREYRLRARVVDLAGNSVAPPGTPAFATTPAEATAPVRFGRFEPVSPPSLMPQAPVKEGASVERMVVRSDFDSPAADIAAHPDQRHVVPPRATEALAEQHGMLDTTGPTASLSGTAATKDLASREAGTLTHRLDLATNQRVQLPGAEEVVVKDADGRVTGTYWIQKNDEFPLAYLPDPIADGAQFLLLPGETLPPGSDPAAEPTTRVDFDGPFPDHQPFRLKMVGIPAGQPPAKPAWLPAAGGAPPPERVLVVQVPQGETHLVRYSCFISAASAKMMGVQEWVKRFTPAKHPGFQDNVNAGRHWMLMPYRTLVLVHAVRQPLALPRITALTAVKAKGAASSGVGETSAVLTGSLALDASSTGKVQVSASWQDPFDDLAKPSFDAATDVVRFTADVGEVQVGSTTDDSPGFALTHFLKDTKFHRVTYAAVGTTRYREYFDPDTPHAELVRPTAAEVAADATSPATDPKPTEEAKFQVDVLNSARPAPPRIHSLIPTFHWDETVTIGGALSTFTRVRRAGALRVYLDRPWFSTGSGEQLGVIFAAPGQATTLPEEERRVLISHLAADPVYDSVHLPPSEFTAPSDFVISGAGTTNGNVTLAETPVTAPVTVSVAGFEVAFDPVRALWYSDLEFAAPAAYFPFVRLALVRFQPKSVDGAHISSVVRADYAQLLPDRTATFTFDQTGGAAGTVKATVAVRGVTFTSHGDSSRSGWAGVVERRVGPGSTDFEWEEVDVMTPQASVGDERFRASFDITGVNTGEFRVVVREYEIFPAEQRDEAPYGLGVEMGVHGHRLVYADARSVE